MSGNKREQRDRENGLTFSWRVPESSGWSTTVAVVLVALITTGLLGTLRVRVVPPPRVIERRANLVMLPQSDEGRAWAISVDEQGPFPAKFDPTTDPGLQAIEEQARLEDVPRDRYRPPLRDLPQESGVSSVPVGLRGERFFPREATENPVGGAAPVLVMAPVLLPLSQLPASAWPSQFPFFESTVSPAMASKTWRYMVEIGPAGRVLRQQPIEVGDDDASREAIRLLGEWIARIRFGAAAQPGWIAVEVAFNRNN